MFTTLSIGLPTWSHDVTWYAIFLQKRQMSSSRFFTAFIHLLATLGILAFLPPPPQITPFAVPFVWGASLSITLIIYKLGVQWSLFISE